MWDFIGDIHGMADKLEQLLAKLGYVSGRNKAYYHPEGRRVFFLGDFIDRGPQIIKTLEIVRNMCDCGNAQAVIGNHEFNLLTYLAERAVQKKGAPKYVRRHNAIHSRENKNTRKEFSTLNDRGQSFIDWFYGLPLFVETQHFRAIHASWVNDAIVAVEKLADKKWLSRKKGLIFLDKETLPHFPQMQNKDAIETLLKGRELHLPKEMYFSDNDGNIRRKARLKWWQPHLGGSVIAHALHEDKAKNGENRTLGNDQSVWLGDCLMIPQKQSLKTETLNASLLEKMTDEANGKMATVATKDKPVFFGHYWMRGLPRLLKPHLCCLDFSVARGGVLAAYRFDGEPSLCEKKLYWV